MELKADDEDDENMGDAVGSGADDVQPVCGRRGAVVAGKKGSEGGRSRGG